MPSWDDHRYVLALSRAGSLSAAARRLSCDQTTVGRRLAALEAEIGARLFDRTPDGYVPTAAGDALLAHLTRVESELLAAERRLAGGDARIEGIVRLAITETFASMIVLPELSALRAAQPGVSLELITATAPADLARREADLAIRLGPRPKQPNLIVRQLGAAGYALHASPAYLARHGRPGIRGGLRGHAVIAYGGELRAVPMARALETRTRHAQVVLRSSGAQSVYEAVTAGLGVGVLPCALGRRGGLERLGPVLGENPCWSVVHEDLARNARVRTVLDFLAGLLARKRRFLRDGSEE